MTAARINFPWLSILTAVNIIAWQILVTHPQLLLPYQLPEPLLQPKYFVLASLILTLLIIFDTLRFRRSRKQYDKKLLKYETQINDLFDAKRELGTRAVTYSDHADKLKMFISDRLLEYIEYDEKFLHFKNIASEVRHNGVISYDRVQTALKQAINTTPENSDQIYRDAGDSLVYLWDLLDLSTTDNIALHIANRIYDCEEHYFQALLKPVDTEQSSPFTPTFSILTALEKALIPLEKQTSELGGSIESGLPLVYRDEQFNILIDSDSELLGNPNHVVLLIENLLNNALYYATQKNFKHRHNRVAIHLSQQAGTVELGVYNRGPSIKESERDHIFQLGFSTRRVRDQNGKGLGLYFVNEIVKGFEGSIDFNNIEIEADSLSLRFELENGDIQTHMLNTELVGNKLQCSLTQSSDAPAKKIEWSLPGLVRYIEITSQSMKKPQIINNDYDKPRKDYYDSGDRLMPRWLLEVVNRKKSTKINFILIDVRGVRFVVKLPTAASRLENLDESAHNTISE